MLELTRFFNEISKKDVGIAGGKGASLGEMTQAKIPVPKGFVILSDSFEKFLEETDLNVELDSILDQVNHKEMQSIENASEEIKALILRAEMPKDIEKEIVKGFKKLDSKFVAVRSSATSEDSSSAAWAGQLDSFLNTKENTLLENVKRCWASLFTPRAIFYRFEKDLHKTKISVAVVVQKMVESEISGIAFSVHPVTQDRNQLIIEAGIGLGEAIVSGQITPDSYVIEKEPRRIIDKNVSEQERGLFKVETGGNEWKSTKEKGGEQKLSDKQIEELSEIILRIENHYDFPCDIEWAYEKGKFFIVQSRPITTLTDNKVSLDVESGQKKDSAIIDFLEDNKKKEITKQEGNLSLLIYGLSFSFQSAPNFSKYYKEDFGSLLLLSEDKRGIGFFSHDDYRKSADIILEKYLKSSNFTTMNEYSEIVKQIEKFYSKYNPAQLKALSDEKVREVIVEIYHLLQRWQVATLFAEALDEQTVKKYFDKVNDKKTNFNEFFEKASLLDFESFIFKRDGCLLAPQKDKYRDMWIHASYLCTPKLSEAAELRKKLLNDLGGIGQIKKEREGIKKEISKNKVLSKKFEKNLSKKLSKLFNFVKISLSLRDTRKESSFKGITVLSNAIREIFVRIGLDEEDIVNARGEDFENNLDKKSNYGGIIAKRKKGAIIYFSRKKNFEEYGDYDKTKEYIFKQIDKEVNSNVLKGSSAFPGIVKGRAKVVLNQKGFAKFNKGEILVTSMTRPEFVPLMKKALAIITDEGGITCHAAIISRELKIPCIIGTKNATRLIKDDDLIEVDANHGVVKILK